MTKKLCNIIIGIVIAVMVVLGIWYYFQVADRVNCTQGSVLVYIKEESGSILVRKDDRLKDTDVMYLQSFSEFNQI